MPRTDLAVERFEDIKTDIGGMQNESYFRAPVTFTKTRILTKEASGRIGKPIGEYLTAQIPDIADVSNDFEEISEILAKEISIFLPSSIKTALVIGLGNRDITPDALGPKTTEAVLATRHISSELAKGLGVDIKRRVAVLSPGVLGQTGIETGEIISGVSSVINPDIIIVIDALAARSASRLFTTLQISDTGITPGSGVGNARFEISDKTLSRPVISVGIPTVASAEVFAEKKGKDICKMIVTPSDVDRLIADASKLLALTINRVLHPEITFEQFEFLT